MSVDFIYSGLIFSSLVEIFKIAIEDILVNTASNISLAVVYKSHMARHAHRCVRYQFNPAIGFGVVFVYVIKYLSQALAIFANAAKHIQIAINKCRGCLISWSTRECS